MNSNRRCGNTAEEIDMVNDGDSGRDTRTFWDERYSSPEMAPSGDPNPQLAAETANLGPGHALDVGTGLGDDAIWLAARGWRVTAVDISRVALDRGKAAAVARGVGARIEWLPVDLLEWDPPAETFDLVTSQFIHFQQPQRDKVFRRLASAVKSQGTLLIVGHDPSDLLTTAKRWNVPGGLHTAPEVASLLDPAEWTLEAVATRPRKATDPEGHAIVVHDAVVRARRVPAHGAR
jgi:SAM-dependent methyltransferase